MTAILKIVSGRRTVIRCPPGTDLLVEKQQSLFLEIADQNRRIVIKTETLEKLQEQ